MPVLLEQGDQEVDGKHGVGDEFVFSHANVADGNTQAQNLLQLELDGGLGFFNLGLHVIRVGNGRGELTSLVQTGTEQTGNLLDDGFRGQENVIAGSKLLDFLLALVQLLQVVRRAEINTQSLGLVAVDFITQNADAQVGTRNVGETDGTGETLVTVGIVVLQTDLEFNSFVEVALLAWFVGSRQNASNGLTDSSSGNFAKKDVKECSFVY